jgi:hypothetical protein
MNKWGTLIDEDNLKQNTAWNKEQAGQIWQGTLDKMSLEYEPGGLDWIRQHYPDMERAIVEAENLYSVSCERRDIAGVNQAAKLMEKGLAAVIDTYKQDCLKNTVLDAARRFKASS